MVVGTPRTEGESVIIPFTITIDAIYAHPDTFKAGVGDTYEGIPIHRSTAIPLNEIHYVSGGTYIKMAYERKGG